jgi:hypothetical protein
MNDNFKVSTHGIFIPVKKHRVQVFFVGGGRVTLECGQNFRVDKDEKGALTGVNFDSESDFPFIRLEAIHAIELIKDVAK